MHKGTYKIKVAFSCNKSFSDSIEELKPFLGFDLKEIQLSKELKSINSENQVLIVDSSCSEKVSSEKINIPKILILKQSEKNTSKDKFDITMKLPISINQFNRAVIDLSQRHKFDQNSLIKVKDYILNKNTRFLKRKESSIKITEKEMHFIESLNNSTKPLTKDYILKNIWGYSSDTDTHTVETHIYRLRQKIKSEFNDENFIKHTKEGYSF
tara:strand:+ start:2509 stop:3144 length:636 start_codon:yes stop_codon:yes gene_type:complete